MFPLVMLALSIIFMLSMIIKTLRESKSDIGIWKTSAMSTLIYGLPKEMQANVTSSLATHRHTGMPGRDVSINLSPEVGQKVT